MSIRNASSLCSLGLALSLLAACGDDSRSGPGDAGVDTPPPTSCTTALDCDDGDLCTTDTCNASGECEYAQKDVDDSNPCTIDACDPDTGEITHVPDDTTCAATCDSLTDPENGTVSTTNGGVYPSTATYACDSGFELTSAAPRECNPDGTWSGAEPSCQAITFFVVRVGDGESPLEAASTAVFLEERDVAGAVVRTIPLPTEADGDNAPFTLMGTATAEGGLSRSADGRYVTFGGYAVGPGVASVNSTTNLSTDATPVNRIVARISADGTVDTSTRLLDAFSGSSIRGVASSDGTAFWASGNGPGGTGGVHYVILGSTGETVRVSGTVNNLRHAHVFGDQLYVSSATGNMTRGVLAVGSGLPTTSGQTAVQVAPFASSLSANSFAVLDLDPDVAGPDTIYIAFDQGGVAGTANIQKWTFDGTTWAQATFAPTITGDTPPIAIGLTTWLEGSAVHIVMTTSETPTRLIKIVDDGTTTSPAATVLDTAATDTAFRGVARSPSP